MKKYQSFNMIFRSIMQSLLYNETIKIRDNETIKIRNNETIKIISLKRYIFHEKIFHRQIKIKHNYVYTE